MSAEPMFINDEWRDALVANWPKDEADPGRIAFTMRVNDPVDLLTDVLQYVGGLLTYYASVTDDPKHLGTPVVELEQAYDLLNHAHEYLTDEGDLA